MTSSDDHPWITLISGMSGSGKSTAAQALEDAGFFCIDNLPPALAQDAVSRLLGAKKRIGLVIDARSGALLDDVPALLTGLRKEGHKVDVLFLESSDEILIRRFSETRRPHPIPAPSLPESIKAERAALTPLRALATRVIDTSNMNRHDLRHLISDGVHAVSDSLNVTVVSFGFKYGVPLEADLVFDVRHLKNPHFVDDLRPLTGLDGRVSSYVMEDPHARELLNRIHDLMRYLLPLYQREGKRYLTVALGCTGGKHRSVTLAEELRKLLNVAARHRDIERYG